LIQLYLRFRSHCYGHPIAKISHVRYSTIQYDIGLMRLDRTQAIR